MRVHERCRFRHGSFPITVFSDARADVAMFGALLDDEWRVAFRTWFVDRQMRRGEVAFGVATAAIEDSPPSASLGRTAANEFTFLALGALDSECDRSGVLAVRILFTADELAVAAVPPE